MRKALPDTVCLRISRSCNANCCFCLAPPDGTTADEAALKHRLDWLLSAGVRTIHFCGGEPTIHPAFPALLWHVHERGAGIRITTNGIEISDDVAAALRATATSVKLSLHGDRSHHNEIVGRDAFDQVLSNLRRLQRMGVPTSIQTTLIREGGWVLDWATGFCLQEGVKRLSLMPFLARGRGAGERQQYALTAAESSLLRNEVKQKRRELSSRLDLRWLDMTSRGLCVVEVDGSIFVEKGSEALDSLLAVIPAQPVIPAQAGIQTENA